MLTTILFTLAALATYLGFAAGIKYLCVCTAIERHLATIRPLYTKDPTAFSSWQRQNRRLKRIRMRAGLTGLCAYAVGMSSLTWSQIMLTAIATTFYVELMMAVVLGASVIAIGIRSTVHFSRTVALELKNRYSRTN